MKKIISLVLMSAVCIVSLSACVQVTVPAPTQQATQVAETVAPQTAAPVQTQPAQTQPAQPVQTPPVQQAQPIQGGYAMPQFAITIDQAKSVALNAVGMNAANVTFTKQKQDYDDGMPEYEIEFVVNNMKYEFEISGINGAVIKQEIESIYN